MKSSFKILLVSAAVLLLPSGAIAEPAKKPISAHIQPWKPSTPSEKPADFANSIDDLPLMPGLELVPRDEMIFVGPKGRIAETAAEGMVDIDELYNFYGTALPQLGWKKITPKLYEREGERLQIAAQARGKTSVRFTVTPQK